MSPAGLLQPLPVPDCISIDIFLDFIEGFPVSNGYSMIMVIIDQLSKYALSHPFPATSVAKAFMVNVVPLHSLPT